MESTFVSHPDALTLCAVLLVVVVSKPRTKATREQPHFQQRINWLKFSDDHARCGTFKCRLRMSKVSFDKLLNLLCCDLLSDEEHASCRGGSVVPEACLCVAIRWLAGGSHLDVIDIAGMSKASFCRALWKTVFAICHCTALDIVFPQTKEQANEAIQGFTSISWEQAMNNCATVVNGFLFRMNTPPKHATGNVGSFFSGHCQRCGANVQVAVGRHSRLACIAFAAPGATQDRAATRQRSLRDLIESLPVGICAVGHTC